MKIGVLTVPFNNNYGGLLQAYALKRILIDLGHDVVFINRRRNHPKTLKYKIYSFLVRKTLLKDYLHKKNMHISQHTNRFIRDYLTPMTEAYFSSKQLSKCKLLGIDAYIVGSDQVWRYQYAKESLLDYFFSFLDDNSLRLSYAASFGTETCDYPEKMQKEISFLLKKFAGISVREESGKDILIQSLGQNAENINVVMDPTFLLSIERYMHLFKDVQHGQNYVATYILDEKALPKEDLYTFCKLVDKNVINLKAQTGSFRTQNVLISVEGWLSIMYYSDVVITDSFHGTVFSILFNKPFFVYANQNRGISRLKSLLNMFGLTYRLKFKGDIISADELHQTIDWATINEKISLLREFSIDYLKHVLGTPQSN